MVVLKVLAVMVGLAFLLFGYFIYFKQKYNLINGYEADFKAGRKNEEYAKRVGMIEFVVGIAILCMCQGLKTSATRDLSRRTIWDCEPF